MSLKKSNTPPGLNVSVDRLVYEKAEEYLACSKPHAFIYHLTIHNNTNREIRIIGRKWIIQEASETNIIEGDGIIGKTPQLMPGESFSYHSYHVTETDANTRGVFYGIDERNNLVHILIPMLKLVVPKKFN